MLARFFAIPFSVRLAVTLWLILFLGVTVRVIASRPTSGSVVPIYLNAGLRWAAEQDLYAPMSGMDVYRNPPGFAALFAPFSDWNPKLVGVVWRTLGLALFLWGMRRLQTALAPDLTFSQCGWLFCLVVLPLLPAYNNGQVNLLLAAILMHGIAALRLKRYWEAATWLSFGTWLKVYPIALAMLACLLYPKALIARLGCCLILGFTIPLAFNSPEYVLQQYQCFVYYLGADDRSLAELSRAPRNWAIISRVWFNMPVPMSMEKVIAMLAGVFVAIQVWRGRSRQTLNHSLLQVLLLGTCWMTAFGPATEANTYTLFAGVMALTLMVRPTWLGSLGYGLLVLTVLRGLFPNDWKFQVLGPQPIGALCLAGSLFTTESVSAASITILSARVSLGRRRVPQPVQEETPTKASSELSSV
jgi:hypothetical protein